MTIAKPAASNERTEGADLPSLRQAFAKSEIERTRILADIDAADRAVDACIVAGDADTVVEKAERRLKSLRWALRRHDVVLGVLQSSLADEEAFDRQRRIDLHKAKAGSHYESVCAAVTALCEANAAAAVAYAEAEADLGSGTADAHIQRVGFGAVNRGARDFWRDRVEEGLGLGLRHRAEPLHAATVGVRFLRVYRSMPAFQPGDLAGFAAAQAKKLVRLGIAEFLDDTGEERAAALERADPHKAAPPEADAEGRLVVVFVCASASLYEREGDCTGSFQPGEHAAFPTEQAMRLVRARRALFVPLANSQIEQSEAAA